MTAELLIPLAIFLALLATFAVLLQRVWLLILESRQLATFRRSVRDLAARIDATLAEISAHVDRVRRHQVDAASISQALDRAGAKLHEFRSEGAGLQGPRVTAAARSALVAEIERAERALDMVEHGCALLAPSAGMQRQAEAETAVKRGYLNLVHAREAIARHAADIEAARPQEELRWLTRRAGKAE